MAETNPDRWDQGERSRLAAELELEIFGHLKTCIANMMALANGVQVEKTDNEGGLVTYRRPPDRAANEYILNRILGRPPSKKPLAGPEPPRRPRRDLSQIPLERLKLMEKWLTEADEQSARSGPGGCADDHLET